MDRLLKVKMRTVGEKSCDKTKTGSPKFLRGYLPITPNVWKITFSCVGYGAPLNTHGKFSFQTHQSTLNSHGYGVLGAPRTHGKVSSQTPQWPLNSHGYGVFGAPRTHGKVSSQTPQRPLNSHGYGVFGAPRTHGKVSSQTPSMTLEFPQVRGIRRSANTRELVFK